MLKKFFSIFHQLSGKVFWFTSAYFPPAHFFRRLVEYSLLKFYQLELWLMPDCSDAYSKTASLLANRGEAGRAVDFYQKALETDHPDTAKIHYFIGKQQLRQSDNQAATESFRTFVRLAAESRHIEPELIDQWCRLEQDAHYKPHWFDGYYFLGEKCIRSKLHEPGIEFLRKSVILEPLVMRAHAALAEALFLSNRHEEAVSATRVAHYFQLRESHPQLGISARGGKNITQPDFMILGVMKCGTTSLYSYLTRHPCITPALNKEIDFFSKHYDRGQQWYLSQFPPIGNRPALITGEASVEYFDSSECAKLIMQHFPDTRFIIVLRDPVERAISQFHMYVRLGLETRDIETALLENVSPGADPRTVNEYVRRSTYIYKMRYWMNLFPREQFQIVSSEQLFAEPAQVCNRVFGFLQQARFSSNDYAVRNKGIYTSPDDSLHRRLREYFKPCNRELEEFLKLQFDWDD